METAEKILSEMKKASKPLSAGQLAELTKIERKEIDKAMKQLKTNGRISSPKVCYWEPAKQPLE
ncbi:MAG: HTH domain-containing protein [Ignavibacteria bacterium]